MTREELKNKAKKQIEGNIGMLFLCTLIVGGISSALAFIPVIGSIGTFVIAAILGIGTCIIYLDLTKKVKPEVKRLFDGFSSDYFERGLIANLLAGIFTFLWSLLFIIPGIVKGIAYSMSSLIVADNKKISGSDALKESMKLMDGHKWEYFVLQLSFIGWYLLVPLTFGLILIYVTPYVNATNTNYYLYLKGLQKEEKKVKEVKAEVV